MSQIDLSTHSAAINDAMNKVRAGNQGIDWLLLSYEGKTNALQVSETGSGLGDLEEAFNDGKIEFAYARVIDENTQLPKFVFISWCGEGVPENRKGLLQLHSQAVEKHFKGFHVHINARSSKDVDKATIAKKVRDSSGANYSFHKETKPSIPDKPQAPVGSGYQKPEIMGRSKDVSPATFTKPADDGAAERRRLDEERRKAEAEERRRAQEEQRQRDEAERQEQRRRAEGEEKRRREEEEEARRRQQEDGARRRQQEEQEAQRRREQEEQEAAAARSRQAAAAAAPPAPAAAPAPAASMAGGKTATAAYDYEASDTNEISFQVGDVITGIEVIDDGWWQGFNPQGVFGMFPSSYVTPEGQEPSAAPADAGDEGQVVAIYDYQAGDDTEISFAVGEVITDIVVVDENWWQGKNASGYFGMFPSAYVQKQ